MAEQGAAAPGSPGAEDEPRDGRIVSVHDYGLVGNENTGALISRHGAIDWACFPRFDSPSVFGALLDPQVGGSHRVAPADRYFSQQQYIRGTNLLATFFEVRHGTFLVLTDFMPMGPPGSPIGRDPRIVRRVSARGAPIDVTLRAHPRFDYGRVAPSWELQGPWAIARGRTERVSMSSPWPWELGGGSAVSLGRVEPGRDLFAQVRWGDPPSESPTPSALQTMTDAYWRAWVSPPDAPLRRVAARWQPWVERSELVLKLLSYSDSGVFVAAPTTSLPEWPGGTRNWDYRYVWIRDAAFTAQVFLLLGHVHEARAYVDWAFDRAAQLDPDQDLRTVYTVDGGAPPPEAELAHLSGFQGSRPVRIGNSAADQRQLDIYGELLDSAHLLVQVDPSFVRDHWSIIERLAQRAIDLWAGPDSGIWEFRRQPAHYVHSKLMCWVALDRAVKMAQVLGRTESIDRWARAAEEIRAAILSRGYDERQGAFVQAFDRPVLDASALRISLDGLLPPSDPRVLSTLRAVEDRLGNGPFVRRYEGSDGIPGPEGAFLLCSFWLVESLAKSGRTERALDLWTDLLNLSGPLLLFAEEYDPRTELPLGNYPQAFTHIGVLRAALTLGLLSTD